MHVNTLLHFIDTGYDAELNNYHIRATAFDDD